MLIAPPRRACVAVERQRAARCCLRHPHHGRRLQPSIVLTGDGAESSRSV